MGVQRFMLKNKMLRPIAKKLDSTFHKQDGEWNPWYRKFYRKEQSYEILHHPDNKSVYEAIAKYKDRFFGWIFLNPKISNWQDEYNKWKDHQGFVGVKIHPFWHRYSLKEAYPIARLAQEEKLPLMVHLGFEPIENISEFASEFIYLKVIFSHAGFPLYSDIWPIIKNAPNFYVDLSSHHVDALILRKVVEYLGSDRCLFGTDDPYGDEHAGLNIQKWIKNLKLSPKDQELIFSDNFYNIINN